MLLAENIFGEFRKGTLNLCRVGAAALKWNEIKQRFEYNFASAERLKRAFPYILLIMLALMLQILLVSPEQDTSGLLQTIFYLVSSITILYAYYNLTMNDR